MRTMNIKFRSQQHSIDIFFLFLICSGLIGAGIYLPAQAGLDWDKKLEKAYHELAIGNVDRAAGMFASETKKHPEAGPPHCGLGLALKKLGKLSEAKAEFRRSTEVEPGYATSFYELGAMLESDKEYGEALKCFERYIQLEPTSQRLKTVEERIKFCRQNLPD